MIILIHTSKTMRSKPTGCSSPALIEKSVELHKYLKSLSAHQLKSAMGISDKLAEKVASDYAAWNTDTHNQTPAKDAYLGDIYSGLQANKWDKSDITYAEKHLRILSGLYGVLRPSDGIMPYRLEMGYKFPKERFSNLYKFWGDSIVKNLPQEDKFINLAAVEYSKTVTPFTAPEKFITPSFLTTNEETGEPVFVVVHAKIARGAFANWMLKNKINDPKDLVEFDELGYKYSEELSAENLPVFVCQEFGGIGLSIRLTK